MNFLLQIQKNFELHQIRNNGCNKVNTWQVVFEKQTKKAQLKSKSHCALYLPTSLNKCLNRASNQYLCSVCFVVIKTMRIFAHNER